jgi:hypothetical protein
MISPKLRFLILALKDQSVEGAVEWAEGPQEETYIASFPSWSVTVSRQKEKARWREETVEYTQFKVFNAEGKVLDEVDDRLRDRTSAESVELANAIKEIYDQARRKALRVDKAIDDIMSLLKGSTTLEVMSAKYGIPGAMTDLTAKLRAMVTRDGLTLEVTNDIGGDPAPGASKHLDIHYRYKGVEREATFQEGDVVKLPQ